MKEFPNTDPEWFERLEASLAGSDSPNWLGALDQVLAHFDGAVGTLHRLGEEGELELIAHRGLPEALLPIVSRIPIGKGMAGLAAERREPVQVCNLQTDDSGVAKPGAKLTQMEGSISLPCLQDGELVGTLGVGKPVAHEYDDDEVRLLTAIAECFARRLIEKE